MIVAPKSVDHAILHDARWLPLWIDFDLREMVSVG